MSRFVARAKIVLELFANAAIVVSAVVGIGVWLRSSKPLPASPAIDQFRAQVPSVIGTRIELPGVNWGAHPATLVVAISSSCHFCVASMPFYRELTQSLHPAPVVIAMPQSPAAAEAFLRLYAITPSHTVSIPLPTIDVEGNADAAFGFLPGHDHEKLGRRTVPGATATGSPVA